MESMEKSIEPPTVCSSYEFHHSTRGCESKRFKLNPTFTLTKKETSITSHAIGVGFTKEMNDETTTTKWTKLQKIRE